METSGKLKKKIKSITLLGFCRPTSNEIIGNKSKEYSTVCVIPLKKEC